jgi:hypothetical protein
LPGLPDTTVGQLLSIVLGGLLLTLAIVLCLLVWLHPDDTAVLRGPRSDALQIASLIDAMRALPGPARPGVAAAIRTPGLRIRLGDASPLCSNAGSSDTWAQALSVALRRLLPSDPAISVHHCHVSAGGDIMEVRAADLGAIFDIEVGIKIDPGMVLHIWLPLISAMLFVFFLVAVLSVWAVLRIIQPLQRLSTTVERFGRAKSAAPHAPSTRCRNASPAQCAIARGCWRRSATICARRSPACGYGSNWNTRATIASRRCAIWI